MAEAKCPHKRRAIQAQPQLLLIFWGKDPCRHLLPMRSTCSWRSACPCSGALPRVMCLLSPSSPCRLCCRSWCPSRRPPRLGVRQILARLACHHDVHLQRQQQAAAKTTAAAAAAAAAAAVAASAHLQAASAASTPHSTPARPSSAAAPLAFCRNGNPTGGGPLINKQELVRCAWCSWVPRPGLSPPRRVAFALRSEAASRPWAPAALLLKKNIYFFPRGRGKMPT